MQSLAKQNEEVVVVDVRPKPPKGMEARVSRAAKPVVPDLATLPRDMLLPESRTAAVLGTSRATLATLRCRGKALLPHISCGRAIRYRVGDVLDFISKNKHEI